MKDRVLVIQHEGQEKRIPLNKERIILGRDADCDFVLNGSAYSRQHVAIHFKFDTVYVENISTGGEVKIGNKPTEYAELRQDVDVNVGTYVLKWSFGEIENNAFPTSGSASGVKAFSEGASMSQVKNPEEGSQPSLDVLSGDSLPELESTLQANVSGDMMMSKEMVEAFAEDDTVTQHGAAVGMFRILSGEINGREIKLEHGKEWIVGRAKECHIAIDNPKLSRHHFRVLQISGGFRVQDLDSSYGIKINGVTVKESQLKSFDTITAGPVEIQFVIADKMLNSVPESPAQAPLADGGLPAVIRDGSPLRPPGSEKTYIPVVASAPQPGQAFQFNRPDSVQDSSIKPIEGKAKKPLPKERIQALIQKFKEWPRSRQILFILVPLVILLALVSTLVPETPKPAQVVANPTAKKANPDEIPNTAERQEISQKYAQKSPAEKAEIQNMYAQAEEARNKGDWQRAHDLASEIVRRVDNYKRAKDILSEAQGYLTDLQIATLTQADNDGETVALANKQKVEELLQQGETALGEKRWDDAQEIYSRALLLDPKNDLATRGQLAAQAKDPTALKKALAIERDPAQQSADASASASSAAAQASAASQPSIDQMALDYQAAKQKIQEGAFRDAYPILKEMKTRVEQLIAVEESGRTPNSTAIAEDKRNLRSKIIESLDLINDQFVLENKTQLDDAQQAIANQKTVEARGIYDSIIKREPLFEEPRVEREKLYKKMISEGQSAYREGLVSESVGDLTTATELYEKSKSLFENIDKKEAQEYWATIDKKIRTLKK